MMYYTQGFERPSEFSGKLRLSFSKGLHQSAVAGGEV